MSNKYIYLILFIILIYLIGVIGFKSLFNKSWIDTFYDTSIVTTTLGLPKIKTNSQKIFITVYSVVSLLLLLGISSYLIQSIISNI